MEAKPFQLDFRKTQKIKQMFSRMGRIDKNGGEINIR